MMRYLFSLLLCLTVALESKAQQIDSIFVAAPEAVLPLLEYNSRLDMLDLFNCGMKAKVYNNLGGESCLLEKDSVSFFVQTSSSSFLQLRALTQGKDTLYSCIRTVTLPEKQSQLIFFDREWKEVSVKQPQHLSFEDCWVPVDSIDQSRTENLRSALSTSYFVLHWTKMKNGTPLLVYEISVDGLAPKDRDDARRCLHPLKYAWIKGKLVQLN